MHASTFTRPPRGFSLIEALVTLVIIGLGVLAAAGLQIGARKGQQEAAQRTAASAAIQDLVERMNANPQGRATYLNTISKNYPSSANGGITASPADACSSAGTCDPSKVAQADLGRWWGNLMGTNVTADAEPIPLLDSPTVCLCLRPGATNDFNLTLAWRGAGPAGSYAAEDGVKARQTCGDTESALYDDPDTDPADVSLRRTETVRYVFPDAALAGTGETQTCAS